MYKCTAEVALRIHALALPRQCQAGPKHRVIPAAAMPPRIGVPRGIGHSLMEPAQAVRCQPLADPAQVITARQ